MCFDNMKELIIFYQIHKDFMNDKDFNVPFAKTNPFNLF